MRPMPWSRRYPRRRGQGHLMADAPGPLLRRGPRPLLLHLTFAMRKSGASPSTWPSLSGGWPNWSAAAPEPAELPHAELLEALRHDQALIAGIAAYRRHPWRRELADPPVLWREGGSRLLPFRGDGSVVMFVPSLVNRATVLDLAPGRSMMRHFAAGGVRALLLDWGWP